MECHLFTELEQAIHKSLDAENGVLLEGIIYRIVANDIFLEHVHLPAALAPLARHNFNRIANAPLLKGSAQIGELEAVSV